jgi:hypothetical protein
VVGEKAIGEKSAVIQRKDDKVKGVMQIEGSKKDEKKSALM